MTEVQHAMPRILSVALGIVCLLLVLAACGATLSTKATEPSPSAPVSIPSRSAPASFSLPEGDRALALQGEPSAAGAWALATNGSTAVVLHLVGSQTTGSWPIETGTVVPTGSALAVASEGLVWVGLGSSLYGLDPASGKVVTVGMPPAG